MALCNKGEHLPIPEGPHRTKRQEKGEFTSSLLKMRPHPSSPALGHQHIWFSEIQTQIRTYTINPLILRPLNLD